MQLEWGKRLRPLTEKVPKALIEVGGHPLVDYAIALLRKLGINKIVLVAGHFHSQVKAYAEVRYPDVIIIENIEYQKRLTLDALLRSRRSLQAKDCSKWTSISSILRDLNASSYRYLRERKSMSHVHRHPPGDMVKVLVDSSGTVTDMRKDIDLAENVYGYIGMFYCPAARVPGLIKFVGRILASGNGLQAKVWSMLAQFAKSESGAVRMADVGKFPCIEIRHTRRQRSR